MVSAHKSNWHVQLFFVLWDYRTSAKTATGFTPFQLVYGLEAVFPIECEIPSWWLTIELLHHTTEEEQRLLCLSHLNEIRQDAALANESCKKHIKKWYDRAVKPCPFQKATLSLSTTRIKMPWQQASLNHYGMVPTLFWKYYRKGLTSWLIMKEINLRDLGMVSIWNSISRKPSIGLHCTICIFHVVCFSFLACIPFLRYSPYIFLVFLADVIHPSILHWIHWWCE